MKAEQSDFDLQFAKRDLQKTKLVRKLVLAYWILKDVARSLKVAA
jgi:hypothetical protein